MSKEIYPTNRRKLHEKARACNPLSVSATVERRPELAHEMWQAGKSFAEIGEMLQISPVRVRQMVHRYAWTLRHPELPDNRKH